MKLMRSLWQLLHSNKNAQRERDHLLHTYTEQHRASEAHHHLERTSEWTCSHVGVGESPCPCTGIHVNAVHQVLLVVHNSIYIILSQSVLCIHLSLIAHREVCYRFTQYDGLTLLVHQAFSSSNLKYRPSSASAVVRVVEGL
jgi:hypothetical protein